MCLKALLLSWWLPQNDKIEPAFLSAVRSNNQAVCPPYKGNPTFLENAPHHSLQWPQLNLKLILPRGAHSEQVCWTSPLPQPQWHFKRQGFGKEKAGMCLFHSVSSNSWKTLLGRRHDTPSHGNLRPCPLRSVGSGKAPLSLSGNPPPVWLLASVTRSITPEPWTGTQSDTATAMAVASYCRRVFGSRRGGAKGLDN